MILGSLFRRSLAAHLVSLVLLTLLIVLSIFVSLRRSVDIWNVNRGQRLENLILPIVADVYRQEGMLEPEIIHDQLRRILTANVYAYVFDQNREPVYFYSLGRRTLLYDQEAVSSAIQRLQQSNELLTPVVDGTEVIGYLTADTVGFTNDAANRRFLLSVTETVVTGSIAAVLVGLAAAWLFSSRLAREARSVAGGIRKISSGRRDVAFEPTRTTELREISDSAARLQDQLAHEERMRRQWMEDIAHDLRTPVAALKSQLEGMTEGYLSNDLERLRSLQEEVEHVEWLVSGLRELSQIESPETEVLFESVDMCELVGNVVAALAEPEFTEGGRVSVRCDGDLRVRVAPHLIRRAVENVVINAVQNVQTPGRVEIAAEVRGTSCVVDVANTGRIDSKEVPRFFDRLYRSEQSARRGGSGLGLPIAKSAVERHGGSITIFQRESMTHVSIAVPRIPVP